MEQDVIELSDSDSESRPPQQESRVTSLLNSELAELSAALTAKSKLVTDQDKELNKLRKENRHLRDERDMQNAEIAGLQDELKNILQQLDDHTVKNLKLGLIKLNNSDHGLRGGTVGGTRHQLDDVQDMFESDDLASRSPVREDVPAKAGPSELQNPASSGSHAAIKQEAEEITVVIKSEEVPDLKTFITFVKSEDGKFDIWNLEHLGLGPPVVVEERFRVGFTRAAISNVIGGGYQNTFNNWQGANKSTKFPYMALKRSWNPYLPHIPGDHGVAFCSSQRFNDGTLISKPVDVFVYKKVNEWVYFGSYEVSRCGEITPHQIHLLLPSVVRCWSEGILSSVWGKNWVEDTNDRLVDEAEITGCEVRLVQYTMDGLREALEDGRLVIGFTVLKCTGYRTQWFDRFSDQGAHSKVKSQNNSKRKKASSGGKKPPTKRVKGSTKQEKVMLSGSDSDDDESESSDVEYEMEARLGSARPTTRQSARISAKRDTASKL